MNKILKGLLVAVLAVSAAQVKADSTSSNYTNKTFLMPRPVGVNLPMEQASFREHVRHSSKKDDGFGADFQVTGFYNASANAANIAKYFLVNSKSTIGLVGSSKLTGAAVVAAATGDINPNYLIHGITEGTTQAVGAEVIASVSGISLKLAPSHEEYGVRLDWHQDLHKLLKGLYLRASLPVAYVANNPKLTVTGGTAAPAATAGAAAFPTYNAALPAFFKGSYNVAESSAGGAPGAAGSLLGFDNQVALANAKINARQSETGVADLDIALGYKFLDKAKYHASLAAAVTVPTGNEAKGVYAFEPIVGNGKHFAFGGNLCAGAQVWSSGKQNINLNLDLKYRYLFENSEKRTYGLKGYKFGQYVLLVESNQANAAALAKPNGLIPAANKTTLNTDVTPGSQLDGILGLAYNNGNFNLDLGYNMYFREEESLKIKAGQLTDNRFAVAAVNYNAQGASANAATFPAAAAIANVTDASVSAAAAFVTAANLDVSSARTPSQFTNGVYAGLGYIFKSWDCPLMLGVGGKYDWASKNSALEQWGVWGKVGIGF